MAVSPVAGRLLDVKTFFSLMKGFGGVGSGGRGGSSPFKIVILKVLVGNEAASEANTAAGRLTIDRQQQHS